MSRPNLVRVVRDAGYDGWWVEWTVTRQGGRYQFSYMMVLRKQYRDEVAKSLRRWWRVLPPR
jgi:hypothetical protein